MRKSTKGRAHRIQVAFENVLITVPAAYNKAGELIRAEFEYTKTVRKLVVNHKQ